MAGEEDTELQTLVLDKVGDVSSSIEAANCVDDVIFALHSLAVRLFPVDSSLLTGVIHERYTAQILNNHPPSDAERDKWRCAFYRGVAFPAMANILIYNIASNWLPRFSSTAQEQIYDSFFTNGPSVETVQALVPSLTRNGSNEDFDSSVVSSNVERLLVLCFLKSGGIYNMARELGETCGTDGCGFLEGNGLSTISRMAQLVASIPDKSRIESSSALSSHLFFKHIIKQLLVVAEERSLELSSRKDVLYKHLEDGTFSFTGQIFARICRRGSVDILTAMMIPTILNHVRSCISPETDCSAANLIESNPKSLFWSNLIGHLKDSYSVEKLSEGLLRHLETEGATDLEAYWTIWMLFRMICNHDTITRLMFFEKFLLRKIFPICCLRWILHFSVFECPLNASLKEHKPQVFLDTVQSLLGTWSKREFVQSAPMEQQAYITAAIGLCVERLSKEELETTKDVLNSILQGVSCRLESPIHLVRIMASSIALVFSKVVDPNNLLYLDDTCKESETIDWSFGLISPKRRVSSAHSDRKSSSEETVGVGNNDNEIKKKVKKMAKGELKFADLSLIDREESIDPVMTQREDIQDADDKHSETSSDSSLQPYDLSDDNTDMDRTFSQLVDVAAALRKPDDPDTVERALDAVETLVRASPDELQHNAADLVKTLVGIRCSDLTVDREEESAERKRQNALVALIAMCPFESLEVLNISLYSSNVDVSQRLLIIDVMSDAAQELSNAEIERVQHRNRNLISTSGSQSWFLPSDSGLDGSSRWVDISEMESPLSWCRRYERTLPSKPGKMKPGKTRRWSLAASKTDDGQIELSRNKFPLYAAAFMFPAMQGFDKRKHGVDFLGRDFIVLGKLIHMLGVCMRCMAMHPEASALAPPLLDMLSTREVAHHAEAYVRRSVLYAASCILVSLHPSFIASALIEGNIDISKGLEWIRTWSFQVSESDPDTECTMMAMTCLQLHSEMALQTSRTLESADCFRAKTGFTSSTVRNEIILPTIKDMGFNLL